MMLLHAVLLIFLAATIAPSLAEGGDVTVGVSEHMDDIKSASLVSPPDFSSVAPHHHHHHGYNSMTGRQPIRIMPLGDSISICCNYCAVPAGVLMKKDLAEPPTPWDGYIRKLWHLLKHDAVAASALLSSSSGRSNESTHFDFEYVGRVRSCMVNRSTTMRVADDWEIRYEGYYGYTTGRVLSEIVKPAMAASDPDVVLLMLGTNDLIQPKSPGRLSRVGNAIENLKSLISIILTTPRFVLGNFSRHVYIAKIPPIWFHQIKAVPPSARKPHRVTLLNSEIGKLVATLTAAQRERFVQLGGLADDFIPTIHVVDMYHNVSAQEDLHGDGLHPNALGEIKIASRWHAALKPLTQDVANYLRVSQAQNDEKQFQAHFGAGSSTVAANFMRNQNRSGAKHRVILEHDATAPIFGEQAPSVILDAALIPVVMLTVLVYAFVVCKPTHRWARHTYMRATQWLVLQQTKPFRPSPQ